MCAGGGRWRMCGEDVGEVEDAGSERDGVMDSGMCGQDEMDDGGNKRDTNAQRSFAAHGERKGLSTHTTAIPRFHRHILVHIIAVNACTHASMQLSTPTTYNHASARPPLPPSSLATHPGPEPNTPLAGSPLSGARARPGRLFSLAVTSSRRDTGQRQTPPERPKPQAQSDHTVAHLLASAGRHTLC